MHNKLTTLFIFLWLPFFATAQNSPLLSNLKLEGDVYAGRIFKHTANFKPDASHMVSGFELSLMRQTFGSKDWHSHYHFPLTGIKINYANFGNPVLGSAISVMPFFQLKLFKVKNAQAFFSYANGLAWLTKKYNRFTDSTNNVIGSSINETSQFKLGSTFQLKNQGVLSAALAFQHYSNAKFTTPNLGINVYSLHIGYQQFISHTPANYRTVADLAVNKKIKPEFYLSFARNESQITGGPKSPYYIAYLGISKRWCYANRWNVGLWYQYDKGYRHALEYYEDRANIGNDINRVAFVLGDGFIFGKMTLTGTFGYYVFEGNGGKQRTFQQIGMQYVLWQWNKTLQHEIFTGLQLKTKWGQAEYFDWLIGCRF